MPRRPRPRPQEEDEESGGGGGGGAAADAGSVVGVVVGVDALKPEEQAEQGELERELELEEPGRRRGRGRGRGDAMLPQLLHNKASTDGDATSAAAAAAAHTLSLSPSSVPEPHSCDDPHCDPLRHPNDPSTTVTPHCDDHSRTVARLASARSLFIRMPSSATTTTTSVTVDNRPLHPLIPLPSSSQTPATLTSVGMKHLAFATMPRPRRQIFEFFRCPIPAPYSGSYAFHESDSTHGRLDLHGLPMEYAIRAFFRVDVGGHLADVVGWSDPTPTRATHDAGNNKRATHDAGNNTRATNDAGNNTRATHDDNIKPNRYNAFIDLALPAAWESLVQDRIAAKMDPIPARSEWEHEDDDAAAVSEPTSTIRLRAGAGVRRQQRILAGGDTTAKRRPRANDDDGEVVIVGSDHQFRWGDRVSEIDILWDSPFELRELYNRKTYLVAGAHSDTYRDLPGGVIHTKSVSTFLMTGVLGTREIVRLVDDVSHIEEVHRRLKDHWGTREIDADKFRFVAPEGASSPLDVESEFELPYDLEKFVTIRTDSDYVSLSKVAGTKKQSSFIRIKRNIYVDRKPRVPDVLPICNCVRPENGVGGCDDQCLNRCMLIECPMGLCPCGDACTNQAFQRQEGIKGLEVFWTSARGYGLRTTTKIPANTLVVEYRGEIIDQDTCLDRLETVYANCESFYFLNYAQGEVIDACVKGTEARFVNHSCKPNCRIDKWSVNGEFCVGLFSGEEIPAGTELTYDYRFESFGPMQRCLCGSRGCRGFIGVNKKVDEKKEAKKPRKDETSAAQPRRRPTRDAEPKMQQQHQKPENAGEESDEDEVDEFTYFRPRRSRTSASGRVTAAGRKTLADAVRSRALVRNAHVFLMRSLRIGVVGPEVRRPPRGTIVAVIERIGKLAAAAASVLGARDGGGVVRDVEMASEASAELVMIAGGGGGCSGSETPPLMETGDVVPLTGESIASILRRRRAIDIKRSAANLASDAISLAESIDDGGADTEDDDEAAVFSTKQPAKCDVASGAVKRGRGRPRKFKSDGGGVAPPEAVAVVSNMAVDGEDEAEAVRSKRTRRFDDMMDGEDDGSRPAPSRRMSGRRLKVVDEAFDPSVVVVVPPSVVVEEAVEPAVAVAAEPVTKRRRSGRKSGVVGSD